MVESMRKEKRISFKDPGYKEGVETKLSEHGSEFFGSETINEVAKIQDLIDDFEKSLEKLNDTSSNEYLGYINDLRLLKERKSEVLKDLFANLFNNILYKSEDSKLDLMVKANDLFYIGGKYTEIFEKDTSEMSSEDVFNEIHKAFKEGRMSDDYLLNSLKEHEKIVEYQELILKKTTEGIKSKFISKVRADIENGILPASASNFLEDVNSAKVRILDKLADVLGEYGIIGGCGDCGEIVILDELLLSENQKKLEATEGHEFVHNIAGRIINSYKSSGEGEASWIDFKFIKNGLKFSSPKYGTRRTYGTWLNEATTELLTLEIFNQLDESDSYPQERERLQRLFDEGLDKMLLYEAYFESVSVEQSKEGRLIHMKK